MGLKAINKLYRFVFFAAVTGAISVFLPWVKVDNRQINGFHGWGIAVLTAFAITVVSFFWNRNKEAINKKMMIIELSPGIAALFFIIIFLINIKSAGGVVKTIFGIWLSLLASVGIIIAGWLHINAAGRLKTVYRLRSISIPIIRRSDLIVNSGVNKIAELEKLIGLKENGIITEEEFQLLSSKIL